MKLIKPVLDYIQNQIKFKLNSNIKVFRFDLDHIHILRIIM